MKPEDKKQKQRGFSDFFRNASTEEKREVFENAARYSSFSQTVKMKYWERRNARGEKPMPERELEEILLDAWEELNAEAQRSYNAGVADGEEEVTKNWRQYIDDEAESCSRKVEAAERASKLLFDRLREWNKDWQHENPGNELTHNDALFLILWKVAQMKRDRDMAWFDAIDNTLGSEAALQVQKEIKENYD